MTEPSRTTGTSIFDVCAIGNALVDVLSFESAELVTKLGLEPGAMNLVDANRADEIYEAMGPAAEVSGGSAANTTVGVVSFGSRASFIGRIADDDFGEIYRHDLITAGVHFAAAVAPTGDEATGRCLVIVTPDAQRTMCTFLGAGRNLEPSVVDDSIVASSQVLYLEGYLWDEPSAKLAFLHAADVAHRANQQVALTLSDPFCVERHRAAFLDLVAGHVDILFANESEICSLYEVDHFEQAAAKAAQNCSVAALTRSERGSVVVAEGERHEVAAAPATVVDTTGAGDLYAAGFLTGFTRGLPLDACAQLGSLAAAEVISHLGARPGRPLAELAGALLDGAVSVAPPDR
jgi:sugar/nucleoside kinase (ribokinase family)